MTDDIILTNVSWCGDLRARLHAPGCPDVELSQPLALGGEPRKWTTEDLFTGAVEGCVLMTFLYFAKRHNIAVYRCCSHAEAHIERTPEGLRFTQMNLTLDIGVPSPTDVDKAAHAVELAERYCPVSHALNIPLHVEPSITVTGSEAPHPRHVNPYDELTTY